MSPANPLGSWWTDHLQLPGYDPIATAGPSRFDPRAAEQALDFFTQLLPSPLSRWEAAIVLNLWGWRQADGQRRYTTVYAEPYRQDALALWCATLGLLLLCMAPARRAPQVTVAYAQDTLAVVAYAHVMAAIARITESILPEQEYSGRNPHLRQPHGVRPHGAACCVVQFH